MLELSKGSLSTEDEEEECGGCKQVQVRKPSQGTNQRLIT